MDIAQYTDKLKAIMPSSMALPADITVLTFLQEKLKHVDVRHLLVACSGVLGFYMLVFVYVYFSAESTIAKMEKKMATVSVKMIKKSPSSYGIGAHSAPKADLDKHEMDKANLIEGLSHFDSMFGRLPIIRSSDHLTSFRAYQTPFSLQNIGDKPVISFVLKEYGLSDKASNMALDILPPEVSFLLSPYADLPQEWINRARADGHEVWIEIPIQKNTRDDAGLNTIYHHDSLIEKGKTMRVSLARGLGYTGVGVFMDESINETREHYIKLAEELYGRGLAVLEMNPEAPSFIETIAVTKGAPFIKTTGKIERVTGINPFISIKVEAEKHGQTIALVNSYPVMIKDLALWIEKVGKIDYVIAPTSAIYDLPLARSGALLNSVPAKDVTHDTLDGLIDNDLTQPENHGHGHH